MKPPPLPLTREQIRELDRIAIEEYGLPGVVLMENAGRNAAEVIRQRALPAADGGRAAILCGGGNNGGDGFVIARHLANAGIDTNVFLAVEPDRLTGDAAVNFRIVERMGLPLFGINTPPTITAARERWRGCDVIVDALLGTGFAGTVRSPMTDIIAAVNAVPRETGDGGPARPIVVAIDLPSGLDANTGRPSNATIKADLTITMLASKVGFAAPEAARWTGPVFTVDIGAPTAIMDRATH